MNIDFRNIATTREADMDFPKVACLVDEKGAVVIVESSVPRYVLLNIDLLHNNAETGAMYIATEASHMLENYIIAFEKLAE